MPDAITTISELKQRVLDFSRARDWEQFHQPKELALALACEVGELLDHFRYRPNELIAAELLQPAFHTEVAHELADCLWLILRLSDVCGVDLSDALREKLALADAKYPVELARGRPDKYTRYERKS
jgi:dCTP diphosphatase